jgi:L-ascorbate metabolism protein UlaG (beta-lactamase superfamily)
MIRRVLPLVCIVLAVSGCSGLARVDPVHYGEPQPGQITFWGHACVSIDVDGVGVVTDPVFDQNLFQRRRFIGSPPPERLRGTRVVLLSHCHDDHTSPESLALFPEGVTILGPAPVAEFLKEQGIAATAMRPGEEHVVDGVRFVAVAAHHPGGRWGMDARADGGALGWVIVAPSATIFYSGDTDYCSTFAQVGWDYSPDIAILNVNGHLMPVDAARAAWATRARVVIPTHWGAYGYWVVGGNRRPRGENDLRRRIGTRLHVLEVGDSWRLESTRTGP